MVFNATFSNISVILLWSVFFVEETGVPRENHRTVASHIMYQNPQIEGHTNIMTKRKRTNNNLQNTTEN